MEVCYPERSGVKSIGITKIESLIRLVTVFTKKLRHRSLTKLARYASIITM